MHFNTFLNVPRENLDLPSNRCQHRCQRLNVCSYSTMKNGGASIETEMCEIRSINCIKFRSWTFRIQVNIVNLRGNFASRNFPKNITGRYRRNSLSFNEIWISHLFFYFNSRQRTEPIVCECLMSWAYPNYSIQDLVNKKKLSS